MKYSKRNSKDSENDKKKGLVDRSNEELKKRDDQPAEEFISPDSARSKPEKKSEPQGIDKMGISDKAKKQPSDQRDTLKNKK